ncbi:MAG: hypothetical protein KC478_06940 [Bacteriovoracaceae bacterium]|nr:hypothetical protein [Bacteriovoracaceae bacterium]
MANIRLKSIDELETWNGKELRKLRITIKNRIEGFKAKAKAKELPASHPLNGMGIEECQSLLTKVLKAEKTLYKD